MKKLLQNIQAKRRIACGVIFFIAVFASLLAQAAPLVGDWPGKEAPNNVVMVASTKLSGLWAAVCRATGSVRVYDIRGKLIHEVTPEDMVALLPGLKVSQPGSGLCGLCFTDSGRQLFMAVRASTPDKQSVIVALNLDTKKLRVFTRLDLSDSPGRCGMAHFGGQLFVGTRQGLLRYEATRNVKSDDAPVTIRIPGQTGICGIAVDSVNKRLYAATNSELYDIDLTVSEAAPRRLAVGKDFRSLTFGRTYGGTTDGGLYALRGADEIVSIPTTSLRASGTVKFKPYYRATSKVPDIAATACGRILLAGTVPKVLSDSSDTRMDFEGWVRDEFKQYNLMNKSVLWPDGEPEGWVKIAAATAGNERSEPASSTCAAATVLMLMVNDSVFGDPDAQGQVRSILKRYAGKHADGIIPIKNIDGQFADFSDPNTGEGTWGPFARPQCYGIMFILPAADRAKRFYPEDKEIQEAADIIISQVKRMGDYVEPTGAVYFWGDEYGPFPGAAYGPYNEAVFFAEIAAAQDPLCTHTYTNILHHRKDVTTGWPGRPLIDREFLEDEPVMMHYLTVFMHHWCMTFMESWRQDKGWLEEFDNYYSHFCAWTDDNGPPYLTVFSAGEAPHGYSPDTLRNHPGSFVHFPGVLGFSILGDPAPAVGAYLAYRDGRRMMMAGTSQLPGANILVRYSPEKPDFVPRSHAQADFHFGLMGLAELIKPGVIDAVCAGHFYSETLNVGSCQDGRVKLDYSRLTPRRVLASNDEKNWVSYGLHKSPFILKTGERYKHYRVVDPEGDVLFCSGDDAWQEGAKQTIDVSQDFPHTAYIVRANVFVRGTSQETSGYLQVRWDNDTNADNGFLSETVSNRLDRSQPRCEFRTDIEKPPGATHMHISIVASSPADAKTGLVVDNVSIVRIGARLPLVNGGFEKGDLSGWTNGGTPSALSMVSDRNLAINGAHALKIIMELTKDAKSHLAYQDLNISGDPLGTRYIIRAEAMSESLTASYGMLDVRVQKDQTDAFDPKRRYFSNKVKPGGPSRLIRTVRKREKDENILRVSVAMSRSSTPELCLSELIVFDDVQVYKVLPN